MPIKPELGVVGDDVFLGDFALAIKVGTPLKLNVQSFPAYCSPERFHNVDPSFASDIWSFICIFAELYFNFPLFSGKTSSAVVSSMVNTLGPVPAIWDGSYIRGGPCDPAWYDQNRDSDPFMTLEARIAQYRPEIGHIEKSSVISILQRGLSYLPEDRPTAGELLADGAFRALMEIYEV